MNSLHRLSDGLRWLARATAILAAHGSEAAEPAPAGWSSANGFRLVIEIDTGMRARSNSPASIDVDFRRLLAGHGSFDETSVEVIRVSPPADSASNGGEIRRAPHRLEKRFGSSMTTLHFAVAGRAATTYAVYFDTIESGRGDARRYHGLVGDGDLYCEGHGRRGIACSHFDCFVDFDGDGDLDLFKGGVEPFVHCYENRGANRFVDRGRISSGGEVFKLPCSDANRSWVTVAFHDIDRDGDQDFFPSFGDGPDAGRIIHFRNVTRGDHEELTFERAGSLETVARVPLAGGAQAGGWFPSITFVDDWDADGIGPDVLVGSRNRCWLYRNSSGDPGAPRFTDPAAVTAGGREIELTNPRFDCADIDGDGDLDLFAGTQPGAVHLFRNTGTRAMPQFAAGEVIAWTGRFLIGDAHSGIKVTDADGDGRLDVLSGRFWERSDLNTPNAPRQFGGFFRNIGTRQAPQFEWNPRGGPFTEQFQICDAGRQNCVRAVDWDADGALDLLAGDTDGFVWFFRNNAPAPRSTSNSNARASASPPSASFAIFETGERLRAAGAPLNVTSTGGHARFDVCDWNGDQLRDVIVADGHGTLTVFQNRGSAARPDLSAGETVTMADGKPVKVGGRSSVLVCDWDGDGRNDLVLADDKGFYFSRNMGTAAMPSWSVPAPIRFGGKPVSYVRPNLGSFVDWDGDGKRDLIGCHFENSIRFYRNIGSGRPGETPQFADPEGVVLVRAESPQMISGADAVDWSGDGDLDLLTGQGHGGSGLRFYERDWIEDEIHGTHPVVRTVRFETKVP